MGGAARTSPTLLERIKARDAEAWRRLVRLYGPVVYRWCRQAGLREDDAADVGQEVFLAVSRTIATFHHDREGDTFRGWLRTITRNKVADFLRRLPAGGQGVGGSDAQAQLLDVATSDRVADESTDEADRSLLFRQAVEAILAGCKEETRQAFIRVALEQREPAEVARELGLSVNAVYLTKSRILRQLRDEYAELLDLDEKG